MAEFDFDAYRREELARVREITVQPNDDRHARPVQLALHHSENTRTVYDLNEAEARVLRDALNAHLGDDVLTRVRALADQWNETPDYTASDYDRGRVDQRHEMLTQLLEALGD